MTIFEEPKVEVIRFDPDDVILTSGCTPGCEDTETEEGDVP